MAEVGPATGLRTIAVDGKSVRGAAGDTFSGCLHLVSAWAKANGVILGQVAVEDKSHEIAAIPELLRTLDLKGALVTIDAAGCQKRIVRQIRDQGGDYLAAVKGNQPALKAAVEAAFEEAAEADFAGCDTFESVEKGHGRRESRSVTVLAAPTGLPPEWVGVAALVMVGREREVDGKTTATNHFYLTSRRGGAAEMAEHVRSHWGVENGLHWCLDVAFREDANRTRDKNAGANLGVARRVAASLLKQDPKKGSIKGKRYSAAMDVKYLERVLSGFQAV